eukprot:2858180-Amphidinium_carterae.1
MIHFTTELRARSLLTDDRIGLVMLDEAHRQSEAQAEMILECFRRRIPAMLLSGTFPDEVPCGTMYDVALQGNQMTDLGVMKIEDFLKTHRRAAIVFCDSIKKCDQSTQIYRYLIGDRGCALHGRLSFDDQLKVIGSHEEKVVFATKIAQEALTIQGVDHVYSPGTVRVRKVWVSLPSHSSDF